jgi:hypothetical protein
MSLVKYVSRISDPHMDLIPPLQDTPSMSIKGSLSSCRRPSVTLAFSSQAATAPLCSEGREQPQCLAVEKAGAIRELICVPISPASHETHNKLPEYYNGTTTKNRQTIRATEELSALSP